MCARFEVRGTAPAIDQPTECRLPSMRPASMGAVAFRALSRRTGECVDRETLPAMVLDQLLDPLRHLADEQGVPQRGR